MTVVFTDNESKQIIESQVFPLVKELEAYWIRKEWSLSLTRVLILKKHLRSILSYFEELERNSNRVLLFQETDGQDEKIRKIYFLIPFMKLMNHYHSEPEYVETLFAIPTRVKDSAPITLESWKQKRQTVTTHMKTIANKWHQYIEKKPVAKELISFGTPVEPIPSAGNWTSPFSSKNNKRKK